MNPTLRADSRSAFSDFAPSATADAMGRSAAATPRDADAGARTPAGGRDASLPSPEFQAELDRELRDLGRTPDGAQSRPDFDRRWGAEVWLKREDLAHTGAHKINNALGPGAARAAARCAPHRGRDRGGPARSSECGRGARVGLPCTVYMGEVDMQRQAPNVGRMRAARCEGRSRDQR